MNRSSNLEKLKSQSFDLLIIGGGKYGKHLKVRVLAVYGGQPYGPQVNQPQAAGQPN